MNFRKYKKSDERAKEFFSYSLTEEYSWNSSHEDLVNTEYVTIRHNKYCTYCSHKMYPIQAGLRKNRQERVSSDYHTTGYTCTCEGAMEEVELAKTLQNMLKEQEKLLLATKQSMSELKTKHNEKYPVGAKQLVVELLDKHKDLNLLELRELISKE